MKNTNILLPFVLIAFSASLPAQTAVTTPPQPQQQASLQAFETPGYVEATLFVPAAKMTGSLHTVGAQAVNNGLQNTYQLTSGGQSLAITGTPLLLQRINEIYALDYLRSLSKTEEFGKALAKSAGAKVQSVVDAAKDPVGTVKNLPKGASRFFGGIGEALKGGKSKSEGSTVDKLAGTNKAKAALALKLGVSPYTDNQDLQDELTDTARAMAGGGLVIGAPVMTVINTNQHLQATLVTSSPDDLRIVNRKKLFALGLDRDQADTFLMHPQYSPWDKTIIVDELSRIGTNPRAFLEEAGKASNNVDVFYFLRLAQLLLKYHKTAAPLRSISIVSGLVCGLDRDGALVIPVSLDYAIWSERVAGRADQFAALAGEGKEIKSLALWTDGQLSQRLCEELTKRTISWKMQALEPANN